MDQGLDSNGKRQTARLPFTSGDSLSGGQSLGGQRFNQSDVYATRIGDDFDDVLDVPIQPQSGYQMADDAQPTPVFEDVYTAGQGQDQPSPYDFTPYDKPPATPIEAFRPGASRQRETEGYVETAEQDFVGWPVLPEGSEEEEEAPGNGRGGLFLRIGLVVGLVGVVCFWAYYFLGDMIAKRLGRQEQAAVLNGESSTTTAPSDQSTSQPPESQVTPETQGDRALQGGGSVSPESGSTPNAGSKVEDLFRNPQPSQRNPRKQQVPLPVEPKNESADRSNVATNTSRAPIQPAGGSRGSRLTIQVGSFKDQGEAEAKASGLNAATDGAFHVIPATIPGRGVWYRVQKVSGFASREAASSYGNQLRARNLISDFIVTMR